MGVVLAGCDHSQATPSVPPVERAAPSRNRAREPEPFSTSQLERIELVQHLVHDAARRNGLETSLINGMIWVESRFVPTAKSSAGARGLMQLMPQTAAGLAQQMGRARARSYDPKFNIDAGSLYIARLRKRYDGDVELALAAYYAGAANADRWRRQRAIPPSIQSYVTAVQNAQRRFEALDPELTRGGTMLARANRSSGSRPAEGKTIARVAAVAPTAAAAGARTRDASKPLAVTDTGKSQTAAAQSGAAAKRVQATRARAPDPSPPGWAVRYDLDRVRSTYQPRITPEPPLTDTPYPRQPSRSSTRAKVKPTAEDPPHEEPAAALGLGILPSVLD